MTRIDGLRIPDYFPPQPLQKTALEPTSDNLLTDFLDDLPVLPKPLHQDLSLAMIQCQQEEIGLINYQIGQHSKAIDEHRKEKQKLLEAHAKAVLENMEKVKNTEGWNWVKDILMITGSAFSIALGAVAIGTGVGVLPGILMIASGAGMLAVQLAQKFGLFEMIADHFSNKNLERKTAILQQINLWVTVGSIFLTLGSLASGYATLFSSGALMAVSSVGQGVLQISNGIVAIGKGITDSERLKTEGESKLFEGRINIVNQKLKELINKEKAKTGTWKNWSIFAHQILKVEEAKEMALRKFAR